MLTVITNPSDHNFSKSPIICEVATDNMYYTGDIGLHAKLLFYIPPNPNVNEGIELSSNSGTSIFEFTNATITYAYAIPLRTVGQTDSQFYDMVLATIIASGIGSVYTVTYIGGGGFMFEAILPGDAYSNYSSHVFSPGSYLSAAGFSFTNVQDGTTNVVTNAERLNYKIGIDLMMSNSIPTTPSYGVTRIYSCEKIPTDNVVKFDLSRIINAQLDYYFPKPNQNFSNICPTTSKVFYVNLYEYYGSPVQSQTTLAAPDSALSSPTFPQTFRAYVLKAGFSNRYNKKLSQLQLADYIWQNELFLTTKNRPIVIKQNQPEYLYFCFDGSYYYPAILIIAHLTDGTIVTDTSYTLGSYTKKGQVVCYPINTTFINACLANKNVEQFTAQVISTDSINVVLSSIVTYLPNYDDLGDNKIFLYTNSMGGVDTFRSEGYYEQEVEFEQELSSRNYYTTDANHLGDTVTTNHLKRDIFKVFTGWKTDEELFELEDLFLAEQAVEVLNLSTYMPIVISSKKYRKHETNQFLKGIEIEYYHQLPSMVTDKLAIPL